MARKLDDVMAALPKARQQRVEARAMELATTLGVDAGPNHKPAGAGRRARATA